MKPAEPTLRLPTGVSCYDRDNARGCERGESRMNLMRNKKSPDSNLPGRPRLLLELSKAANDFGSVKEEKDQLNF